MKETLFFATFNTVSGSQELYSDRFLYFGCEKTLLEFQNWVQNERSQIESLFKGKTVVTNIQFIKSGY